MTEYNTGQDWVGADDFDAVPYPDTSGELELQIVPLQEFAAVDEPGAAAILGTPENAIIPEGGDAMIYGDGGVGKTTLTIDLACHLAAGDDWLGLTVPRPVHTLIVENEGPRPLFRKKLARKLAGWQGSPLDDRIKVLEQPWGQLSFSDPAWRAAIADAISKHQTDVLTIGPLTSIGMEGAGTIAEARHFLSLIDDVRQWSHRQLAMILVHHENKGGKVSGAWEGAGDTLLHVQQQSHARIRVYFQKARWASEQHATTMQLVWADGDSFELAEPDTPRPEATWQSLEQFVLANAPCSWNDIAAARDDDGRKLIRGQRQYLQQRRDQMLEDGVLINAGRGTSFELWHRDDPARPRLLDDLKESDSEAIPEPESQPSQVRPVAESLGNLGDSATGSGDALQVPVPGSRPKREPVPGEPLPDPTGTDNGPIPARESEPSEEGEW